MSLKPQEYTHKLDVESMSCWRRVDTSKLRDIFGTTVLSYCSMVKLNTIWKLLTQKVNLQHRLQNWHAQVFAYMGFWYLGLWKCRHSLTLQKSLWGSHLFCHIPGSMYHRFEMAIERLVRKARITPQWSPVAHSLCHMPKHVYIHRARTIS